MKRVVLLLALCFLAFSTPSFATNIVVNGGFETVDSNFYPVGWTNPYTNDIAAQPWDWNYADPPYQPSYPAWPSGVDFGQYCLQASTAGLEFISQDLPTQAGATYTLSFWLGNRLDTRYPTEFVVNWGNTVLADTTTDVPSDMTYFTYNVTASSATTTLAFGFWNSGGFYFLDNVDVEQTAAPTPIPSALLLFGPGLAGLAFVRRRFGK